MLDAHRPIATKTTRWPWLARGVTILAPLTIASFLMVATTAVAEVDRDSLSDEAEVVATAFDGAGESDPVRDRSGRIGFAEFLRTVRARDRNADSGRSGRGDAFQDTEIVENANELLGVDSRGTGSAGFTNPQLNDGAEPVGTGLSELTVQFEVVGDPVKFSLTGEIDASATPETSGVGGHVNVVSPSGVNHSTETSSEIEETGELQPGTHTLSVELDAHAFNDGISSGAATAEYDIKLRFCTITISPLGEPTNGTPGDDVICGSEAGDTISGKDGKDRIFGLGGPDLIEGDAGADRIDGDAGDDLRLYGGLGDDIIDAGPGDDGPAAPGFENVVAGGPGDDDLTGGAGSDRLVGRCLELVLGSPSPICPADPITAGETDDDNLIGGLGDDFLLADGGSNFISGGAGNEIATADGPSVFVLGGGNDSSLGGAGSDDMEGGSGDDLLEGAGGTDCLVGGSGKDELQGDSGNDKLLARDGKGDIAKGGAGPDGGVFDPQDRVTSVSNRNLQGGC